MGMRVLYTSADRGTPSWEHTRHSVESYLDRVGGALVNLPKPVAYQPQWVLFDAFRDSLSNYGDDAVFVWMDSDILVAPDAPDLFDLPDKFFVCPPGVPKRVHPNLRRIASRFNLPNVRPYLVTGIVRWSSRHVARLVTWFDENHHRFPKRIGDQELLVVAAYELEMHTAYLPDSWHRMTRRAKADTKFFHAAGSNKKSKINRMSRRFLP